jgi:hypothetical protein
VKVVRTTREVIEGKLLAAIDDKDHVALILTKQDLIDLITACERNQFTRDLRKRCVNLADGMRRLFHEAF